MVARFFVFLLAAGASLAPVVASAEPPPTRESVAFRDELPSTYRLERLRLIVDNVVVYDAKAPFNEWLSPRDHTVVVIADYRLNDKVLTYLKDYAVEVKSTHVIKPQFGHWVSVMAAAYERGDATTPVDKRAEIRWVEAVK